MRLYVKELMSLEKKKISKIKFKINKGASSVYGQQKYLVCLLMFIKMNKYYRTKK